MAFGLILLCLLYQEGDLGAATLQLPYACNPKLLYTFLNTQITSIMFFIFPVHLKHVVG